MPTPLRISPACDQDITRLTALIREAFGVVARRFGLDARNCPKHPSNCTERWVRQDMARGVRYFLAATDEAVVGCLGVEQASGETCYLERLAVRPAEQRKGVGAALVSHGIDVARRLGARTIGVGIIAGQTELADWYRALGFKASGTRRFDHLPFEVAFMEYKIF